MAGGRIKVVLALLIAFQVGAAQAAQDDRNDVRGRWIVEWDRLFCAMARSEPASGVSVVLQSIPGSWTWRMRLAGPGLTAARLAQPDGFSISLQPGDQALSGTPVAARTESGEGALDVYRLPHTLLTDLERATSLRVAFRDTVLSEFPLARAGSAVRSVRECERTALQELGVTTQQLASIAVPPRGNIANVILDGDYPAEALRANMEGHVTVFLMVGADGRVANCRILAGSGHDVLDRETCRLFVQRFQAEPAMGSDGNPVAAPLVATVNWAIAR